MSQVYTLRRGIITSHHTHPHSFEFTPTLWWDDLAVICDEAAQWCEEQIGRQACVGAWSDRNWSRPAPYFFCFRNAVDAAAFKLRWA